jgi:N-acetyltransferase
VVFRQHSCAKVRALDGKFGHQAQTTNPNDKPEQAMQAVKPMVVEPVTLTGSVVRLEPLTLEHAAPLARVGLDPELWRWIPTSVTSEDEMRAYVQLALDEQKRGVSLPFAIVSVAENKVIGCTRYMNIEAAHRRLEIGSTWLNAAYQRTRANTEAKLLLLSNAFDTLGAHRVELKTDALNQKSRNAIARIGAFQEGIFRKHLITASGRIRDTVYFSIIDSEWPAVKEKLTKALERAR